MSFYPIVRGVRLSRPIRRTLYQLDASVVREGMTPYARFASAIELTTLWLKEKTLDMPDVTAALEEPEENINISFNGISIRTISLSEGDQVSWAMDFVHPDNLVPTRLWETQAVIHLDYHTEAVEIYVESSFSVSIQTDDPEPTVPGFVHAIAEQVGLLSVVPLVDRAWTIKDEAQLEQLYRIITNTKRELPVIVISAPDYNRWPIPGRAPNYIISGDEVAHRCFGRCLVVQLPYLLGFRWSDKVGRHWSVFDGGVRIYRPDLDFDNDDIFAHTLYSKNKILAWERDEEGLQSYQCFERFLISEVKRKATVLHSALERKTFTTIFQRCLEKDRLESSINIEQLKESYDQQISALQEANIFQTELAEDAYQKYMQLERDSEILREKNYNLECLVETLQDALKNTGKSLEDIINIPNNYDDMADWCERYFSGKLVFTNRARRAISKDVDTLYEDVELVYRCLAFLASEYRDVKTGKQESGIIQEKLKELQVENRPAANNTQAGRHEEEYFYTDENGAKHMVEMHLVRGRGRDTRKTLRIYYYWDEAVNKTVVVSLTRHLTTAAT